MNAIKVMKNSLKIKITFGIIGIAFLSNALTGFLTYNSSKEIIEKSLQSNASSQVETHVNTLDAWLQTRMSEVDVIANTDTIRSGNMDKMMDYFKYEKERTQGVFNSFGISDTKGNLTLDAGVTIQIGNESTFPQIMEGRSVISNPFPAKEDPKSLIISFEAPVYDANKKVTGLISGASLINKVFEENTSFKVGKTDTVYIFQKDGTMIYHPNKELVLNEKANLLKSTDENVRNLAAKMVQNKKGFENIIINGQKHVVFYNEVPDMDWVMALDVPVDEFFAPLNRLLLESVSSAVLSLILIGFSVFFSLQRMFSRLNLISHIAKNVAQGDLVVDSIHVVRRDEIGELAQLVNEMVRNLRNLITQVAQSSSHVNSLSDTLYSSADHSNKATEWIAKTIQEVAIGTEKQVNSVHQGTNVMTSMTSQIKELSDYTGRVTEMASVASDKASSGNITIQTAIKQMNSIQETVTRLSEVISGLGDRSKEIGTIIQAISGISTQTNLLALNAAIEAARAGEHGRGFAIVADEVRRLAEQSNVSAQQIAQLIESIQRETNHAVSSMDVATKEVNEGIEYVNQAGYAFNDIQQSVDEVVVAENEVQRLLALLSHGTNNLVEAMTAISQVANETASGTQNVSASSQEQLASIEEISASSQALAKTAGELHALINRFKV
ncbi:MAG TPA: methyl-accepting chemotaxis protein [Bacillota bacterium]|nr:methyl-accepting chemotaxis protein [Bacillota bacterium]